MGGTTALNKRTPVGRPDRIADRLASLAARLAPNIGNPFGPTTVAADTPTISVSTTATVSGQTITPQHTNLITEIGSRGFWNSTFSRWNVSGTGGPPGLDFFLYGTTVEFQILAVGAGNLPMWIFVNGVPVTATLDTTTMTMVSNTFQFVKLVFPSTARRRVEIFFAGGAVLASWYTVRVDNLTVVSPAPRKPVIGFVGDSFYDGATGASSTLQCAPFLISRLLDVECVSSSYGGTGYVAAGSFQVYGSATRTGLMAAVKPELLVISGSVNDDARSGVQAAASAAYAAFQVASPNTSIVVFGPQPTNAVNTVSVNRIARISEVRTAALAAPNVIGYFDMVGASGGVVPPTWAAGTTFQVGDTCVYNGSVWQAAGSTAVSGVTPGTNGNWALLTWGYTGTGTLSAPTGNGTRDVVLYSDAVHPMPEGSAAMAIRQADSIRALLGTYALQ